MTGYPDGVGEPKVRDPRCVLSGPVSRYAACSISVTGPWGPREARNLIKMLEMQISWFEEDGGRPAESRDSGELK
jgi:hypothetical protein